ncbi:pisatin demethylase [Fusarium solani]
MPYLQAVIKEALRLHPGVGTQLTRVVPKGGVVIEGQFFPEGVEVGVNAWALYHNQDVFGKDASEFRPERWLEPDNEDLRIAGSFAFGAGPRSCLGKNISILEMSKAIPQIVSNFNLYLEPHDKEWVNKCWWFVKPEYKAQVECRIA